MLALIIFLPKNNFYYFMEKKLYKKQIIISKEKISENFFSLKVEDANIYYSDLEMLNVAKMDIKLFLLYNSLNIRDTKVNELFLSYMPQKIDNINFRYTIFNPLYIDIKASGKFGDLNGAINILDRDLNITISPSKIMLQKYKKSLKLLKKNELGEYKYDKSF
jgi:hypothetical protein